MKNWLSNFLNPKRAKIAAINTAYLAARGRYTEAKRRGDTRDQHDAAKALRDAQTARLRLEMGR